MVSAEAIEATVASLDEDGKAKLIEQGRAALYAKDVCYWAHHVLNIDLWSLQAEIAKAHTVYGRKRILVQSCHSAGKSLVAAVIICHWVATHEPHEVFVVTSAPTHSQVVGILWRYIKHLHQVGKLPGVVSETGQWKIDGRLIAIGRKPSDYSPTSFQGWHAKYLMVFFDEADGMPESLFTAAESLATQPTNVIFCIGNPDSPFSAFAYASKKPNWHVIKIDAFSTPNFTGEEVSPAVRESVTSRDWVEERRQDWGETDPRYISKVLAEFPQSTADTLCPANWLLECTEVEPDGQDIQLGLDIAAGGDQTVCTERIGNTVGRQWTWQHNDPMGTVGEIVNVIRETGATHLVGDVIGLGYGVMGRLDELYREGVHKCKITKLNVAERSTQPKRYYNKRAELWFLARELSREQLWNIANMDNETREEITSALRLTVDSQGRDRVEPKDDMRKRLGRSPDKAESTLMAFWRPSNPARTAGSSILNQQLFIKGQR